MQYPFTGIFFSFQLQIFLHIFFRLFACAMKNVIKTSCFVFLCFFYHPVSNLADIVLDIFV